MESKVINYASYEALAITIKCYSDKVALPYVTLGLCGELGEFYEKLKQEADDQSTVAEFQDILWYLATIRIEFSLKEITDWPKPSDKEVGPFDLPSSVGKIAEQIKKYLRDGWKEDQEISLSEERKEKIQSAWNEVMQIMVDINDRVFDLTMNQQGQQNIEKLASRKQRNVIHGSGDNR